VDNTQLRGRKLLHGASNIPQLEHAVRNTRRRHISVTPIKGVRKEESSQVSSGRVCSCHGCIMGSLNGVKTYGPPGTYYHHKGLHRGRLPLARGAHETLKKKKKNFGSEIATGRIQRG
jgi:hypothetical protein